MNRHIASALGFGSIIAGAAVAAVAMVSVNAYADDITIDKTPFVSVKTRAAVVQEVLKNPELTRTAGSEWALQLNPLPVASTGVSPEQLKAEYKASREMVNALNAEDSGSSWFMKAHARTNTATMGGSAH